ncbi:NAD(P)/FAD-dependent oxidoreductase [Pseudorhodoplanes sp.]|uniref:NAD(P)/FAD-dependent oxidoreductase n=1 Tax=Pseudorhodoplanes sp. TaxID=1934341 RepID=UPI002C12CBF8|nr:FCSD flavin-binding domain-containing protein [Pseudorhodoplanes sp.]HWV52224.1 FCSD flavin-binding domain-containing protein [Pseudorhodoplanes sp.]
MAHSNVSRRQALALLGGAGAGAFAFSMPAIAQQSAGRVVVVGGGFGGATAARYLKRGNPKLSVTLIEPAKRFYTCPFTNLYFGGLRTFEQEGHTFDDLRRAGVQVVHERASDIDTKAKSVALSGGRKLPYDKLVLSPGIDFRWGALEGYDEAAAQLAPHAWQAGPQTTLLKKQLDSMQDGGLFIIVAPDNPFRCPPGPYERASMVAHYLKTKKPKSKLLILDAKDSFSKQGLFQDGWKKFYADNLEWVPRAKDGKVVKVNAKTLEVETEFGGKHKAAVLNVIPPQKAGAIADRAGVTNQSGWVPVKPQTFESTQVPDVYVVGDATIAAPMPKSGFCANAQGKVAAAAIVAALAGRPAPTASWANTCYSLIAPDYGISVAGVYAVDDGKLIEVKGSGGVSPREAPDSFRKLEADYGVGWYNAITQDTWGSKPAV